LRWTFVLLLVSPYFVGKNYDNAFYFYNVIRHNILVSFLEAVRDNVVSDDVTITSSSDVIILGIHFLLA